MKEKDLKPGDAAAIAHMFAIFHAALVIAPVGIEMPFHGQKKRTVRTSFREAGLYNRNGLSRRGRRLLQLAYDEFERKQKGRKPHRR